MRNQNADQENSKMQATLIVDTALGYTVQFVDFPSGVSTASPLTYLGLIGQQHLYNMSGLGIAPDGSGLTIPESLANDPVTKAVYDNIMGNISKKPKVTVYCDICSLEFSSQIVLDTHLAGSKHQRKVKAKELLKSLEETEAGFERNPASGVIRCTICDVTVNSPQLLATHVAGNKHKNRKNKRLNSDQDGPPTKKQHTGQTPEDSEVTDDGSSMVDSLKKKEKPIIDIPDCVTRLEDENNKTNGKYICNPCQAHCNSDIQLYQHLGSKKHLDKVSQKSRHEAPNGKLGGISWRGGFIRGRGAPLRQGVSKWSAWDSLNDSHHYHERDSAQWVSENSHYNYNSNEENYDSFSHAPAWSSNGIGKYHMSRRAQGRNANRSFSRGISSFSRANNATSMVRNSFSRGSRLMSMESGGSSWLDESLPEVDSSIRNNWSRGSGRVSRWQPCESSEEVSDHTPQYSDAPTSDYRPNRGSLNSCRGNGLSLFQGHNYSSRSFASNPTIPPEDQQEINYSFPPPPKNDNCNYGYSENNTPYTYTQPLSLNFVSGGSN